MATIKRNGDKVVLKDGKASCSCCSLPIDCCMYEANLFISNYGFDDLPDNITILGQVFSKQDGGGEFGNYYVSGGSYIQYASDLWLLSGTITEGYTFESGCLIGIYIPSDEFDPPRPPILVTDQFANTYTLAGDISWEQYSINLNDYILTRISLCEWLGDTITISLSDYVSSGTCDVQFFLVYRDSNSTIFFSAPNWTIDFYYSNWNVFYSDGSPVPVPGSAAKYKGSNELSSPIGLYDQGFGFGQWEIA